MAGESQREPEARPDPTVITTEIISKEIQHLREKLETRLQGFGDAMEERLRRIEDLGNERDRRYVEAVDAAFAASEKAINAAFKSAQEAVTKAETSIEKRADATYVSLNDLQRQLTNLMPRAEAEQRIAAASDAIHRVESFGASVVSREEYTARHTALQDSLANLASRMDKQEGYTGGAQVDRSLQAIRAQVDANTQSITGGQGRQAGGDTQRNLMFAFAGFAATLLGIAVTVAALWPR